MKKFMDCDFLLSTPTARTLYHEYAENQPIVDYHCHINPKEIWEDRHFANITEVWLEQDHYKWRLMRANGVEERFVTGDADPREKFQKFAEMLPKAVGNPIYHWCHLELKKYFGYEGVLNGDTAQLVWDLSLEKLRQPDMGARGLIKMSNVTYIGTTDDPLDNLEWHKKLAEDPTMDTVVAPCFRPDRALNPDKPGWLSYIQGLSEVSGIKIDGIDTLEEALASRMEYFASHGCRISDHGYDRMAYRAASRQEIDAVVKKGLAGEEISEEDAAALKTALTVFCAAQYTKMDWAMQIHYNSMSNANATMARIMGGGHGFDCVGPNNGSAALAKLFDRLYGEQILPRTILYSLDAGDNLFLDTLIGTFQEGTLPGKLQHGSAWWFNDNKQGMQDQLISLSSQGLLGNFIGMLTDSRSFLSYTRHEYFRRILCELIGTWAENGECPDDMKMLGEMVADISYHNAVRYFKLKK